MLPSSTTLLSCGFYHYDSNGLRQTMSGVLVSRRGTSPCAGRGVANVRPWHGSAHEQSDFISRPMCRRHVTPPRKCPLLWHLCWLMPCPHSRGWVLSADAVVASGRLSHGVESRCQLRPASLHPHISAAAESRTAAAWDWSAGVGGHARVRRRHAVPGRPVDGHGRGGDAQGLRRILVQIGRRRRPLRCARRSQPSWKTSTDSTTGQHNETFKAAVTMHDYCCTMSA